MVGSTVAGLFCAFLYSGLVTRTSRWLQIIKFYTVPLDFIQPLMNSRLWLVGPQLLRASCILVRYAAGTFLEGVSSISALYQAEVFPPQESLRLVWWQNDVNDNSTSATLFSGCSTVLSATIINNQQANCYSVKNESKTSRWFIFYFRRQA